MLKPSVSIAPFEARRTNDKPAKSIEREVQANAPLQRVCEAGGNANAVGITKRNMLVCGTASVLASMSAGLLFSTRTAYGQSSFEISKSDAEWRQLLTDTEFEVLRNEATEKPYSSPLNDEKRAGTYNCAGCQLPVYSSETKYDSGTGWPSFYTSLPKAIGTKQDNTWFVTRIEVHCRRCGGHLGHIFDDGPQPTGLRHCLNGVALEFAVA